MPAPTPTPPTDYSNRSKAELLDIIHDLERALADIAEKAAHEEAVTRAREEERAQKRAAGGSPRRLGTIDVYDLDEPEDVLARAVAVRAGKIPASVAKRFKTDARYRAPADSKLAKRLGAREVPLGTTFAREELPEQEVHDLAAAGAIIPID